MARTSVLTKEQIIECVFQLTNEVGFNSVTIRSIAKALGTSTAPIYTQFPNLDAIYNDLALYVENKLRESTQVKRTKDGFLDLGVGILAFALEYKSIFKHFFLTENQLSHDFHKKNDYFLSQMKQNPFLSILDEERLKTILSDMWIYTYGLSTMICTEMETNQELSYYQTKLEAAGQKIIGYHLYSSGKYETYVQMIIDKCSQHVDIEEIFG